MATYTSTVFKNNTPKYDATGNLTVSGQVAWTAASSIGDVAFLAKVPNHAKIVDFYEYHTTGATATGIDFGLDKGVAAGGAGNQSCFYSAGAQATMNRLNLAKSGQPGKAPLEISLSDLDTTGFATLKATMVSGTATTSLFVNYALTYRFDGPQRS